MCKKLVHPTLWYLYRSKKNTVPSLVWIMAVSKIKFTTTPMTIWDILELIFFSLSKSKFVLHSFVLSQSSFLLPSPTPEAVTSEWWWIWTLSLLEIEIAPAMNDLNASQYISPPCDHDSLCVPRFITCIRFRALRVVSWCNFNICECGTISSLEPAKYKTGHVRVGTMAIEFHWMAKIMVLNFATSGIKWSTISGMLVKVFSTMIPFNG